MRPNDFIGHIMRTEQPRRSGWHPKQAPSFPLSDDEWAQTLKFQQAMLNPNKRERITTLCQVEQQYQQ